jgi:hypothetical protein
MNAASSGFWTPTVCKPAVLYAKAPTKTLRTNCVPRSRMKLRSSRGEYWFEAICKAMIVSANTSPVTVIIVDDTTISIWRASWGVPWKTSHRKGESSSIDTWDNTVPATRKNTTDRVGMTHSALRR